MGHTPPPLISKMRMLRAPKITQMVGYQTDSAPGPLVPSPRLTPLYQLLPCRAVFLGVLGRNVKGIVVRCVCQPASTTWAALSALSSVQGDYRREVGSYLQQW